MTNNNACKSWCITFYLYYDNYCNIITKFCQFNIFCSDPIDTNLKVVIVYIQCTNNWPLLWRLICLHSSDSGNRFGFWSAFFCLCLDKGSSWVHAVNSSLNPHHTWWRHNQCIRYFMRCNSATRQFPTLKSCGPEKSASKTYLAVLSGWLLMSSF